MNYENPAEAEENSATRLAIDEEERRANQVAKRPPNFEKAGPPPWDEIPPHLRRGITLDVVAGLRGHLGPVPADPDGTSSVSGPSVREAAPNRTQLEERYENASLHVASPQELSPEAPKAAVLVSLFEEDGEARVLLTRRSQALKFHRGEVSFPGGGIEEGETPEVAALREAQEEIGLDPSEVDVIGRLTPLATFSSQSAIVPVVAILGAGRPNLEASQAEVDKILDVSVSELASPGVCTQEIWRIDTTGTEAEELGGAGRGARREVNLWFFELPEDTVWGATGRMLVELVDTLLHAAVAHMGSSGASDDHSTPK